MVFNMSSSLRVFVVTGANKGIGRSIVKLLLQDKEEKIVYLTSRNVEFGQKVIKDFEAMNLKPNYHQLDITNQNSIDRFRDHLWGKYGGLDVLVNNAGIAFTPNCSEALSEQAAVISNCNFFGTLNVCDALFPLLQRNARVVHLSSMLSEYAFKRLSPELKARFTGNLTIQGVKDLINEFISDAKEDKVGERGWPVASKYVTSYGMSKVGLSFMAGIQQKMFDEEAQKRNIIVNSCCPGNVHTDMTDGRYPNPLTSDQGADTPTFLALLPEDETEPKGQFCKLRKVVPYPPTTWTHVDPLKRQYLDSSLNMLASS